MSKLKTVAEWLNERGLDLAAGTSLDEKTAAAIAVGRDTTSPQQRAAVARALATVPEEIGWGRTIGSITDHKC